MKKGKVIFWIILGLVVIGVVLAVLFLTLFGEKNTDALAKNVNSYSTSEGYLSSESARYKKIDEYLESLDANLINTEAKTEVKNFKDSYKSFTIISKFFNNEIYYMNYSDAYKKQRKAVEDGLKVAQDSIDKFIDQIEKNKNATHDSDYWNNVAWTNCSGFVNEIKHRTADALSNIADIYTASVASNILNNDFSSIMFIGLKNLMSNVNDNPKQVSAGQKLLAFANAYFEEGKEAQIMDYVYSKDASRITKVKDIMEKGAESEFYENFIAGSL